MGTQVSPAPTERLVERILDLARADAPLILRRVIALLEGGEDPVKLATRLNGPARRTRSLTISGLADAITEEPSPSKADVAAFGRVLDLAPRQRTDADRAFELRVNRESRRGRSALTSTKPAPDPKPPTPEADPEPKLRPVKRPAKPKADRVPGFDSRHGTRISIGKSLGVTNGRQSIRCACGNVYTRPAQRGRIPGTCEACA